MVDLEAVEVKRHNARQARISAELACCTTTLAIDEREAEKDRHRAS
jgi:hypothetical protein